VSIVLISGTFHHDVIRDDKLCFFLGHVFPPVGYLLIFLRAVWLSGRPPFLGLPRHRLLEERFRIGRRIRTAQILTVIPKKDVSSLDCIISSDRKVHAQPALIKVRRTVVDKNGLSSDVISITFTSFLNPRYLSLKYPIKFFLIDTLQNRLQGFKNWSSSAT
jgi:hypothetical protein